MGEFYYVHRTGCPHCGYPEPRRRATDLYEGVTVNPGQRSGQHSDEKPYWPLVKMIEVSAFDPRVERGGPFGSLAYERESIGRNRMPYNNIGNPDYEALAGVRAQIEGRPLTLISRYWRLHLFARRLGVGLFLVACWVLSVYVTGLALSGRWATV